jgi:hypothetical protein
MAKVRGDDRTQDLLDWEPPVIVRRFDDDRVRTATLRSRIARAVSETLRDCEHSREVVATAMSDWLGEEVSKNMLDAYASEAREDHTIPYLRLLALTEVTRDPRLLQIGAEMFGYIVVEERYRHWIRAGMEYDRVNSAKEVAAHSEREAELALRLAKRGAS